VAGDQKLTNHKNSDADNSLNDNHCPYFWKVISHVYFMRLKSSLNVFKSFCSAAIRNGKIWFETPCACIGSVLLAFQAFVEYMNFSQYLGLFILSKWKSRSLSG
jgi:hypothetical protein